MQQIKKKHRQKTVPLIFHAKEAAGIERFKMQTEVDK
jgi:hypothetical protein